MNNYFQRVNLKTFLLLMFIILFLNLSGCVNTELIDLDPKGPVAKAIDELFWLAAYLMTMILTVVFVLMIWIVRKYQASQQISAEPTEWVEPKWLEVLLWLISGLIVLILATISWRFTFRLDPYKSLDYPGKPLQIQVIALDWKWLFIYPEQNIAVLNQVVFPVNRQVTFRITSGTVMNSFFIPRLAGQIYAMGGMETHLHLVAAQSGRYFGENIQYSGKGFPYQHFEAIALSKPDFADWAEKASHAQIKIDMTKYQELAKPSIQPQVEFFAPVQPRLFDTVISMVKSTPGSDRASIAAFTGTGN